MRLLETLRALVSEKKKTAATRYAEFIVAAADDKPLKPAEVLEVLSELGKSHDDLAADVAIVHSRRADAAIIKKHKAQQVELAKVEAELAEKTAAFEEVHRVYREKANALNERIRQINQFAYEALNAETRLGATIPTDRVELVIASNERLSKANAAAHSARTLIEKFPYIEQEFNENRRMLLNDGEHTAEELEQDEVAPPETYSKSVAKHLGWFLESRAKYRAALAAKENIQAIEKEFADAEKAVKEAHEATLLP